jgi:hypothetical protein
MTDQLTAETTASGLPAQFSALEPFADWIIEKQNDRYMKRINSPMAEMQAFYDVGFPLMPELIDFIQQYDLDDLPDEVRLLMRLIFSLVEVSLPVEIWRQGRVPDSGAAHVECIREPLI